MTGKNERRTRLQNRTGHYLAREWGEVERRIALGGVVYPDGGMVIDGWPQTSPCAQWNSGDGGSSGPRKHVQHFAEVHTRESVLVCRALARMTELERLILRLVYVEGRGAPKTVWLATTAIGRNKLYEVLHGALSRIEEEGDREEGRDKSENSSG
ncbi:MAG: hypothetical protein RIR91_337 [Verrucomicrobiota bacterium]|jgi:hypothetical protein